MMVKNLTFPVFLLNKWLYIATYFLLSIQGKAWGQSNCDPKCKKGTSANVVYQQEIIVNGSKACPEIPCYSREDCVGNYVAQYLCPEIKLPKQPIN